MASPIIDRLESIHTNLCAPETLAGASARRFGGLVRRALHSREGDLVVDLSQVLEIDACGIAALIGGYRLARAEGRGFALVAPSEATRRRLARTDLHLAVPLLASAPAGPLASAAQRFQDRAEEAPDLAEAA